jgi:hypothetical protein
MAVPERSKLVGDLRARPEGHNDPYPRPPWLPVAFQWDCEGRETSAVPAPRCRRRVRRGLTSEAPLYLPRAMPLPSRHLSECSM